MQASQRRKVNSIKCIENTYGRIAYEQSDIGDLLTGSFSTLFTTSLPTNIESCLQALCPKLTTKMSTSCMREFTTEEVKVAVFQMNPLGSPGPDCFPAQFYQKH